MTRYKNISFCYLAWRRPEPRPEPVPPARLCVITTLLSQQHRSASFRIPSMQRENNPPSRASSSPPPRLPLSPPPSPPRQDAKPMAQLFARPLCENITFSGRREPTRSWKLCTTCLGCGIAVGRG